LTASLVIKDSEYRGELKVEVVSELVEQKSFEAYPDLEGKPAAVQVRVALRREELLRLLLAGHRLKECASLLRWSTQTMRNELANVYFRKRLQSVSFEIFKEVDEDLAALKADPAIRLAEMADKALDEIESLMESGDERIRLRAAQDTLDRNTLTSKTRRLETNSREVRVNIDLLARADQAAKEVHESNERARTS